MAVLVATLIQQAFVDLGVCQPGESITSTMQDAAFLILQQMISGWNDEELMAYQIQLIGFTPSAGITVYSMGVGASINTAFRPVRVTSWNASSGGFTAAGNITPLAEFRTRSQNPTARSSVLPEMIAIDTSFTFIGVYVFPAPAASPGMISLQYWIPLVFSAVTDLVTLADGWEAAIHFNLAIALSPQYARVGGVTPELAANASNSKGIIVTKNAAILGYQQAQQQPAA